MSDPFIHQEIYASLEKNVPAIFCQFGWSKERLPVFTYAEGKLKSILGFSKEKKVRAEKSDFWGMVEISDRLILEKLIVNSEKSLGAFTWEGKFNTLQEQKWLRAYLAPKALTSGVVWSGVITDISALKRDAAENKEIQDLLRETEKLAKIGSWELDLKSLIPVWSHEVYRIHELDPEVKNDLPNALDFFPGEARATLENALKKAIEEGTGYDLELPFISAKGKEMWVRTIGKAKSVGGKILKIYGVIQDISFQKAAEERNRTIESLLTETEELSHCGSWEANLVTGESLWSAEAFRIYGLTPKKGSGPRNEEYERMIHPEDYEKYRGALVNAIKEGKSCNYDFRIVMPSGEIKHIQSIGKPVRNENGRTVKLFGAIQDITERKNIEEALKLKQEQLKTFITYSPAAIAMVDTEMRYIAASDVWRKDYNMADQEIIGKNHYEIFQEIECERKKLYERCLQGEILRKEEDSFKRFDGSQEWLRWELRPWYEKGNKIGGIIMYTEVITQRKIAQQELIEAKEQAEQAAWAKSLFLATMSHEIRTPMNAVIGLTNLLLANDPRPDQIENLSTLRFSAKSLLEIINDILDLNKIEAGKIEFENIDFNLKELITNIRASLLQIAQEKRIQLKLLFDEDLPELLIGDPVRLGQILTNLLNNALKFTLEGSVTVTVSLVNQNKSDAKIHFEITDTGIGIPEDKLENIFDSFTQASAETTRKFGGTGLGLTITKKLLDLLGSNIKVDSVVGKGSKFFFELNLKKSTLKTFLKSDKSHNAIKPSLKGTKLLLAEDNKINIMVARQFLNKWSVEFDVAEDGAAALELVKKNNYHLILMDLLMPEMDGYMATKAIRGLKGKKYKLIPIIALTASAMVEVKDRAFEAGMVDYISKPFDPDQLYEKIAFYSQLILSEQKIARI